MKIRLKVLRAERDWTQLNLAVALDVSRQTVNRSRQASTTRACRWRSGWPGCSDCRSRRSSRTGLASSELVEMGENRTPRPEHGCRELPTGISGQLAFRDAGPRPAGCFACYPVMPLGSLTPLTGVGDAAPPLMTSSPSGEDGRRQCSLPKQRGRNYRCQLQQLPAFLRGLRATSTCDSRFPGAVET
jgi:hypothetical protein